jgi:hypothetical protein
MYRRHMHDGFIAALRKLSQRYQIVVMGEREIEYNEEYRYHGEAHIYCIYEDLKQHLPIVDLTVPKLGLTSPSLRKLREDCTIMRDAKCCIVLGHGGGPCLALAVGQVLGFRTDEHPTLDALYPPAGPQPQSARMFYDHDSNNWGTSRPMRAFLQTLADL